MRRYTPLFFIAFIFLVVLLAGSTYMEGYADHNEAKNSKSLTVYTSLPVEHVAILAAEYEKTNKIKVNFVPLSERDLLERIKEEGGRARGNADVILTTKEILLEAAKADVLLNYASEQTDIIPARFKDDRGAWVGVWYDPIVFCANKDYLKTLPVLPASWDELAKIEDARIGLTDFLAADAAANLLYTMVAEYDEQRTFQLLQRIHPKVVQYAKFLSTPVRMAGMGEVDISIAVQSESLRYSNDGFPISLIYPSDGTAYLLTGAALTKNTANKEEAKQFIHWLIEDDVQFSLQENKFFFVPTNQETIAYKSFSGKNLVLFENYSDLDAAQKYALLDRWVKNVRLK